MARLVSTISDPHDTRQLIGCDPASLQTSAIPLKSGQGRLLLGSLLTEDGERTTVAGQTAGVLAFSIDSDLWEDGRFVTIYTAGRFLWKAIRVANPSTVFDQTAIATLKSKQITFEPTFSGVGNYWIGQP